MQININIPFEKYNLLITEEFGVVYFGTFGPCYKFALTILNDIHNYHIYFYIPAASGNEIDRVKIPFFIKREAIHIINENLFEDTNHLEYVWVNGKFKNLTDNS